MKKNEQAAKNLTKLLVALKKKYSKAQPPQPLAPIAQLTLGFLQWNATTKAADDAFDAIIPSMVDYNELRVTHLGELVAMLGQTYPRAQERMQRLLETLNEIYLREHKTDLLSLKGKSKKEIKQYLETLPGIPYYCVAQVTLICFAGHALPVDDHLASLLIEQAIAQEGASPKTIANFLEKQVRSSDALAVYALLQAWADDTPVKKVKIKKTTKKTKVKTVSKITAKTKETSKKAITKKEILKKEATQKPEKSPITAKKKATKKVTKKNTEKTKTTTAKKVTKKKKSK